jgi:hypothetical protein
MGTELKFYLYLMVEKVSVKSLEVAVLSYRL